MHHAMKFPVIITGPDEDGYYVAVCPVLPGCHTQGETVEEALANIREAILLYLEVLKERGEPIPTPRLEMVEVGV